MHCRSLVWVFPKPCLGLEFGTQDLSRGLEFGVQGLGFRVRSLGPGSLFSTRMLKRARLNQRAAVEPRFGRQLERWDLYMYDMLMVMPSQDNRERPREEGRTLWKEFVSFFTSKRKKRRERERERQRENTMTCWKRKLRDRERERDR